MYDLFSGVGCCFVMKENELTKRRGWLNKSEMAASLGISVQAFDKWGVEPESKIGRESFYSAKSVLANRLQHDKQKQQPGGIDLEGLDPLAEYKLTIERLRLTAAQADAQEEKNRVTERINAPVAFMTFALAKISAQVASTLETVGKNIHRKHPEIDSRHIESLEREIAIARNTASGLGDKLPEILNEYFESLAD